MAAAFAARGDQLVGVEEDADAYVVNTCTVTAEADRQLRQWLRSVRRRQPSSLLVAVGCAAERNALELRECADVLVGNVGKSDVVSLVDEHLSRKGVDGVSGGSAGNWSQVPGRTRSLLKIQEGCLAPCTYCIVPRVRRGEMSTPLPEVLSIARERLAAGHKELVLTGTRPGAWRDASLRLVDLVGALLELPDLGRLRISSLQPQELSPELLSLWSDRRLCPHFHLALQSGSGTVLRQMARGYTPERFTQSLSDIRAAAPGAAVTTDVIVGFPGETDEEFEQSVAFCGRAGFARMHVFPFSPRPGTLAAEMAGAVPVGVMRTRLNVMHDLAQRSRREYVDALVGRAVEALWEEETSPGSGEYTGTSENYLRLISRSDVPLHNVLERVVVVCAEGDYVRVRRGHEDTGGSEAEREGPRH